MVHIWARVTEQQGLLVGESNPESSGMGCCLFQGQEVALSVKAEMR